MKKANLRIESSHRQTAAKNSTDNQSGWEKSPFPTVRSSSAFLFRLRFILKRQAMETWLPSSLRNKIQSHCERLISHDREQTLTPSTAQKAVEALAMLAFQYDHLTMRSSTLCQIRALDMELNEERYRKSIAVDFNPCISA